MRRFYQTEFLLALYSLLWDLHHFSGLRHIREMASARRPNSPNYETPPTLVLWIIGVYVALYGIAATRYEAKLDRVENRMGALASQLATSDREAFKRLIARIPRIQGMETPLEPSLLWPFEENSVFSSHFFSCPEGDASSNKDDPRYFVIHSLLCEGRNPEILKWTRETIETWKEKKKGDEKGRLAGVDLNGVDLAGADLEGADLSGADLEEADLSEANLEGADLSGAWLYGANFSEADLEEADLSEADLKEADLSGTGLRKADLSGARLREADLSEADLKGADLSWANLEGTNLSRAVLEGANLFGAWLEGADLSGAGLRKANLSGAWLLDIENWQEIQSIENANILGVLNAPEGFRDWASKKGAVEMEFEAWRAFRKNR
uniref:Uncharacterized protein YjbI, contains pentapeptide repeats n=1 Tax=Candidatus Kentrum sp. LFY TaxID=2126342 RepID=A0A450WGL3_9GAMM|nr:MAG: Uncharacterized protein YjbI, contains pentapeptide repeats [Candidatus Kentron sp. LFY]